eukprot:Blabericola_migrator_1__8486@NODE_4424_length_1168_cov_23_132607_g2736_i0_p1_GENE_NODE_4424_length_1168_cov_23_132607_g2736_i0NODE_4424_length_1168_cov_23_132607_g2736_i0_p1_ORF_typecomplete_len187_score48_27PhaP_Bmeg/PF09602_10/0_029_NODE_4424_length_1168_cov_23_132607_g2736_i05011061
MRYLTRPSSQKQNQGFPLLPPLLAAIIAEPLFGPEQEDMEKNIKLTPNQLKRLFDTVDFEKKVTQSKTGEFRGSEFDAKFNNLWHILGNVDFVLDSMRHTMSRFTKRAYGLTAVERGLVIQHLKRQIDEHKKIRKQYMGLLPEKQKKFAKEWMYRARNPLPLPDEMRLLNKAGIQYASHYPPPTLS